MGRLRLLLVGLALLATACGAAGDAPVRTEGGVGATGAAEGDVLDFSWGTPAGSVYDPHVATNPFVYAFLHPVYDRLLNIDEDGRPVPMLAESFEFVEDDTALVLTLRDDVVFHDGEVFDAAAVVANLERARTLETSTVKSELEAVGGVEAVDDHTVRLDLTVPAASLPALLADRAGMMVSPAAFDNDDLDIMPVGSGPYRVVDHEVGNVIRYEAFEDHWNVDAQGVQRLNIFMQLDPETRLNALRSGQIDATTLEADQIDQAEAAGLVVDRHQAAGVFLMYLNKGEGPLRNVDVRRALAHAVDREGITAALFEGNCDPTAQIFPPGNWASDPDPDADRYAYDPDRARALLEQAGFGDGFAMTVSVVNVPFFVAQTEALQAQFADIGVDLDVQVLEPAQLLASFTTDKTADAYYSAWPGATDPAATAASLLIEHSFLNPGGYVDPDIIRLHSEALATTDRDERTALYRELSRVYVEQVFHLSVCAPGAVYAMRDGVSGFRPDLKGMTDFRGVTAD